MIFGHWGPMFEMLVMLDQPDGVREFHFLKDSDVVGYHRDRFTYSEGIVYEVRDNQRLQLTGDARDVL